MVKKFLKIAGVKSEAEFYKKYPSEKAFFKAHPEAKNLKKYKQGGQLKKLNQLTSFESDIDSIVPEQQAYGGNTPLINPMGIGSYTGGPTYQGYNPIMFGSVYTPQELIHTGSTQAMRDAEAYKQAMMNAQASQQSSQGGGMGDMSKMLKGILGSDKGDSSKMLSGASEMFSGGGSDAGALTSLASGMAKRGKKVKRAQAGIDERICNQGFKYDPISTDCIPDFSISTPDKKNTAASPGEIGDYEEVQKFKVNPELSTGTPKTGPGTGVNPAQKPPQSGGYDFFDKLSKSAGLSGKIYQGFRALQAEKEQRRQAEQQAKVSDLTLQATLSKPEQQFRKYVRPEDYLIQPEQLFPTYGVGTNVLTAQNGRQIGGNPGEIQNTYAPNNLYDDLGYEPLPYNDIIKQYPGGGNVPWDAMGSFGSQAGMAATGNDAGGQIGSDIGGAAGEAIGNAILPGVGGKAGKAIGSTVGAVAGGLLDRNPQRIKRAQERAMKNAMTAAFASGAQAIQAPISAHVKNGGWVSHDWQPQVITQFGEHSMQDLLRRDPMMNTLRTGGRITQNNMYPQDQYGFGGELQTTWGGKAEPISYNPFLPGTGETVMFKGNSHEERDGKGRTGIGVKYGGGNDYSPHMEYGRDGIEDVTDVEVERNEPAIEMTDPQTGEKNMVVFGNLKIPNSLLHEIGDPNAKGKKFKGYAAHLSKMEQKQNKILDKSSQQLDSLEVLTPYDKLKFDALQASIIGATAKLKDFAKFKTNAASVQSALNDTAEEYGIDADHLSKGKVKIDKNAMNQAKWGKSISKAQDGKKLYSTTPGFVGPQPPVQFLEKLYQQADAATGKKKKELTTRFQELFHTYFPGIAKDIILSDPDVTAKGKSMGYKNMDQLRADDNTSKEYKIFQTNEDGIFGHRTKQYHGLLGGFAPSPFVPTTPPFVKPKEKPGEKPVDSVQPIKRNKWMDLAGQLIPYLRPSDVDYSVDITPEMMALSMNTLEPTEAQLYSPQLLTPYDISYQDQLNEVTAQARAAERMAGQNPAAAAAIMGQASPMKSRILGEQFRQNQAQRMGIYNQNIQTLNDARLKNLAILEDQAKKQAMARSNTKAQAMAAASSIADKIAKNKLENRTLQVYENLYNYRYTPDFRAINMNAPYQFDYTVGGKSTGTIPAAPEGYEWDMTPQLKKKKKSDEARNGRLVRAMKHI